jgi:hypothetical protein
MSNPELRAITHDKIRHHPAVVSTCEVDISELVTPFVETTIPVEAIGAVETSALQLSGRRNQILVLL